ncbi:hypothetical protein HDU97_006513 [Phlyctochytrium planicorne]|nr:hypothetical protein HDU97_006513 [Phlyctochytrium planicorne]
MKQNEASLGPGNKPPPIPGRSMQFLSGATLPVTSNVNLNLSTYTVAGRRLTVEEIWQGSTAGSLNAPMDIEDSAPYVTQPKSIHHQPATADKFFFYKPLDTAKDMPSIVNDDLMSRVRFGILNTLGIGKAPMRRNNTAKEHRERFRSELKVRIIMVSFAILSGSWLLIPLVNPTKHSIWDEAAPISFAFWYLLHRALYIVFPVVSGLASRVVALKCTPPWHIIVAAVIMFFAWDAGVPFYCCFMWVHHYDELRGRNISVLEAFYPIVMGTAACIGLMASLAIVDLHALWIRHSKCRRIHSDAGAPSFTDREISGIVLLTVWSLSDYIGCQPLRVVFRVHSHIAAGWDMDLSLYVPLRIFRYRVLASVCVRAALFVIEVSATGVVDVDDWVGGWPLCVGFGVELWRIELHFIIGILSIGVHTFNLLILMNSWNGKRFIKNTDANTNDLLAFNSLSFLIEVIQWMILRYLAVFICDATPHFGQLARKGGIHALLILMTLIHICQNAYFALLNVSTGFE